MSWLIRLISLVLFSCLCALLTYWFLTIQNARKMTIPRAAFEESAHTNSGAASILFGALPIARVKIQLTGIVTTGNTRDAAAVLSVNDAAAQAIRVGYEIIPGIILREVRAQSVVIDNGGASEEIFLPKLL